MENGKMEKGGEIDAPPAYLSKSGMLSESPASEIDAHKLTEYKQQLIYLSTLHCTLHYMIVILDRPDMGVDSQFMGPVLLICLIDPAAFYNAHLSVEI